MIAPDGTEETVRVGEECATEFIWSDLADDSAIPSLRSPVSPLECIAGSKRIAVTLDVLGDARWLAVHKYMWSGSNAGLGVAGPSEGFRRALAEGTVTVDVTRAEGRALRYPQLVTPDYVRRYTVHIESIASSADGVSVVAEFEVEQTAQDVAAQPNTVCYCL